MARTYFDRKRHPAKIVFSPDDLKKSGAPLDENELAKDKRDASAPCAARKLGQGEDRPSTARPSGLEARPSGLEARPSGQGEGGRDGRTENAVRAARDKEAEKIHGGRARDSIGASSPPRPTGELATSGDGVERHAFRIYDDTDVCRTLGLRRRILVQHRTAASRGTDWGCVGEHAGMTEEWIRRWNRNADMEGMKPIEEGDGITTVKMVGHVTNSGVILAAKVSDGTRVMVRVLDARYLHRGDEMDCRMQGGILTYAPEMNRERY